jgi:small conductance mechanosensitive channel
MHEAMPDQTPQAVLIDLREIIPWLVANGLNALAAVVILLVGLWAAGRTDLFVTRMLARTPHFDAMLKTFFASIARYLVVTVTVLAVLSRFGIQTTSLIAVIGAASLAIGLALQGTLTNLAAGVMLLIIRPFRIGHRVQIGGFAGTVKELSLFWTELVTDDKVQIIVPNSAVWGQPLRNFSFYPTPPHAGEARFRIPETTKLDWVLAKVEAIVVAHPGVLKDPAPTVLFDRTPTENALEIVVTFSTLEGATAAVKSDLIKAVHDLLVAEPANRGAATT